MTTRQPRRIWSKDDLATMKSMAKDGKTTKQIAKALKRTETAIEGKMGRMRREMKAKTTARKAAKAMTAPKAAAKAA